MIRVRRIESRFRLIRRYELELAPTKIRAATERLTVRRGEGVRRLEQIIGVGDAWSFLDAADHAWESGSKAWAVEYEHPSP